MRSDRLFRALLRLLPFDVRADYGREMEQVFREQRREARNRGLIQRIAVWAGTTFAVLRMAPREHVEQLRQDVRYALRSMRRQPAFTLVAILTLALGIGANVTIFSLTNGMLLRPIAAANPIELVRVYSVQPDGRKLSTFSYPDYEALRDHGRALNGLAAIHSATASWARGAQNEQLLAEAVSGNYFAVLGKPLQLGRAFTAEEDHPTAGRVVVISDKLWRRNLASDLAVVGATMPLNGELFTIVGVAAPEFSGSQLGVALDVWVPIRQVESWVGVNWVADRSAARVQLLGRRKPGVTVTQAEADLKTIAARLGQEYPRTNANKSVQVQTARYLDGRIRASVAAFLGVVTAIVGLVLLTACANLASLMLVRVSARRRELAIRRALGAGRGRLLRQMLTESLVLSLAGGAVALVVSAWMSGLLPRFNPLPPSIPIELDLGVDWRVIGFLLALSVVTGVVVGVFPAVNALGLVARAGLREDAQLLLHGPSRSRMRSIFVAAQVAVSLLLLIGAALFLQSLGNARQIDVGFDPTNALATDLAIKPKNWSEDRGRRYFRDVSSRVTALPGVRSAAMVNLAPLDLATPRIGVRIQGVQPPSGQNALLISFNRVSPGYFDTLRIPLVTGRDFTDRDDTNTPGVAVVNETFARRFWPNDSAIGKRFHVTAAGGLAIEEMAGGVDVEVIGVARNVKYRTLGEDLEAHMYLPYLQHFDTSRTLIVRTAGDPGPMLPIVQRELLAMEPDLPGFFSRTLEQHAALAFVPARVAAALSTLFGTLALLLATIGIYGVTASSVAQRTREIGVRMALGAKPGDAARLILGGGLKLIAAGAAVGIGLALALSRFVSAMLYGVAAANPIVFAGAAIALGVIAGAACWIPARRAASVDAIVALRQE